MTTIFYNHDNTPLSIAFLEALGNSLDGVEVLTIDREDFEDSQAHLSAKLALIRQCNFFVSCPEREEDDFYLGAYCRTHPSCWKVPFVHVSEKNDSFAPQILHSANAILCFPAGCESIEVARPVLSTILRSIHVGTERRKLQFLPSVGEIPEFLDPPLMNPVSRKIGDFDA